MSDQTLRIERRLEATWAEFQTPNNTISRELIDSLRALLQEHRSEPQSKVLVLRGSGERLFSPGLDLNQVAPLDRPQMREFMVAFCALYRELFTHPKPTLAALNGHALAGGCIVASSCDFRLAAEESRIGFTPLNRYLPIPAGCQKILHFRLGTRWASELAFRPRSLAAEEALATGWLNWVGSKPEFNRQLTDWVDEQAHHQQQSFALSKENLQEEVAEGLAKLDEGRLDSFLDCWFSPETQQEIARLQQKLQEASRR